MSRTTHTPGPWLVGAKRSTGYCDREIVAESESAFALATVHDGGVERECEANAALIAAAPELAEALRGLLVLNNRRHGAECGAAEDSRGIRHPKADCTCGMDDHEDAARAAIAKADGK